jgi:hypothetical protein
MDWRPIETAPKDGTVILAVICARSCSETIMTRWATGDDLCVNDTEYWLDMSGPCPTYEQFRPYSIDSDGEVLHWMPLPEPPEAV